MLTYYPVAVVVALREKRKREQEEERECCVRDGLGATTELSRITLSFGHSASPSFLPPVCKRCEVRLACMSYGYHAMMEG